MKANKIFLIIAILVFIILIGAKTIKVNAVDTCCVVPASGVCIDDISIAECDTYEGSTDTNACSSLGACQEGCCCYDSPIISELTIKISCDDLFGDFTQGSFTQLTCEAQCSAPAIPVCDPNCGVNTETCSSKHGTPTIDPSKFYCYANDQDYTDQTECSNACTTKPTCDQYIVSNPDVYKCTNLQTCSGTRLGADTISDSVSAICCRGTCTNIVSNCNTLPGYVAVCNSPFYCPTENIIPNAVEGNRCCNASCTTLPPQNCAEADGVNCGLYQNCTPGGFNITYGQYCCTPPNTCQDVTCSDRGGEVCLVNYHCSDNVVAASDTASCCLANCEPDTQTCLDLGGHLCTAAFPFCMGNVLEGATDATTYVCCSGSCSANIPTVQVEGYIYDENGVGIPDATISAGSRSTVSDNGAIGLGEGFYSISIPKLVTTFVISKGMTYTPNTTIIDLTEAGDYYNANFILQTRSGFCVTEFPSINLSISNIHCNSSLNINWNYPCDSIVKKYELYKNGNVNPYKIFSNGTFSYIDSETSFGNTYYYSLKIIFTDETSIQSSNIYKSTGNIKCANYTQCLGSCGGNLKDGYYDSKIGCNANNEYVIEPCANNAEFGVNGICVPDSNGNPICKGKSLCTSAGGQNNIFGMFWYIDSILPQSVINTNKGICYMDFYSNFQTPQTTVDNYLQCKSSSFCYDYNSQSACEDDNCNVVKDGKKYTCAWYEDVNYFSELGKGICYAEEYNENTYCDLCNSTNTPFANAHCSAEVCDLLGGCYSGASESSCISCRNPKTTLYTNNPTRCEGYETKIACVGGLDKEFNIPGVGMSADGFDYSDDACQLGVCKWDETNQNCYKDANDDGNSDCATDLVCQRDTLPSKTSLDKSQITFNSQGKNARFNISNIYGSPDHTIYYCIDKNNTCIPTPSKNVGLNLNTLFIDDILVRTFLGSNYRDFAYLRFFSIDGYKNVETIKSERIYINTKGPNITLTYGIYNNSNNVNRSDIQFNITVDVASNCSDSLILIGVPPAKSRLIGRGVTANENITIYYTSLTDGNYKYNISCRDAENNINTITISPIKVDRIQKIIDLKPSGDMYNNFSSVYISFKTTLEDIFYCKYNQTSPPIAYGEGGISRNSVGGNWVYTTQFLPNLAANRLYIYNVKCYNSSSYSKLVDTGNAYFTIDMNAPTTTLFYKNGAADYISYNESKRYNFDRLNLKFSCNDTWTGIDTYGCKETYYCISTNQTNCVPNMNLKLNTNNYNLTEAINSSTTISNGRLCYYSIDKGGNTEDLICKTLIFDNIKPIFNITIVDHEDQQTPRLRGGIGSEIYAAILRTSEEIKTPQIKYLFNGVYTNAEGINKINTNEFTFNLNLNNIGKGLYGNATISVTAEDLYGNVGTNITSGKDFIIDAKGPNKPIFYIPNQTQVEYYVGIDQYDISGNMTDDSMYVKFCMGSDNTTKLLTEPEAFSAADGNCFPQIITPKRNVNLIDRWDPNDRNDAPGGYNNIQIIESNKMRIYSYKQHENIIIGNYFEFANDKRKGRAFYRIENVDISPVGSNIQIFDITFSPSIEKSLSSPWQNIYFYDDSAPNGWFEFSLSGMNEDHNYVKAFAYDEIGNAGNASDWFDIVYDNKVPEFKDKYPIDGDWINDNKTDIRVVVESSSPIKNASCMIDTTVNLCSLSCDSAKKICSIIFNKNYDLIEKEYLVSAQATNVVGLTGTIQWRFTIDRSAPSKPNITITQGIYYSEEDKWYISNNSPEITVNSGEIINVTGIRLSNGSWINATFERISEHEYKTTDYEKNLADGIYNIELSVKKYIEGHWSGAGKYNYLFVVDTTNPIAIVRAVNLINSLKVKTNISYWDKNVENISLIGYFNESPVNMNQKNSTNVTLTTGEGVKSININVVDKAGNEFTNSTSVIYDITPPKLNITITSPEIILNKYVTEFVFNIDCTCADTNGCRGIIKDYNINNGLWHALVDNQDLTSIVNGYVNPVIDFKCSALDNANNSGNASTKVTAINSAAQIISNSPNSTNSLTPEIKIITDQPADCYLSPIQISDNWIKMNNIAINTTHILSVSLESWYTRSMEGITSRQFEYYVRCVSYFGLGSTEERFTILFDKTPLQITSIGSSKGNYITDGFDTILTVITNKISICKYSDISSGEPAIDYNSLRHNISDSFANYQQKEIIFPSLSVSHNYTIYVDCADEAGNNATNPQILDFTIYVNEPLNIISVGLNGSLTNYTNNRNPVLFAKTNINSTCMFNGNLANSKQQILENGRFIYKHNFKITSSLAEGVYTHNVVCSKGNVDDTKDITFTIDTTPPTAPVIDRNLVPELVNINTVFLEGTSDLETTVLIYVNGVLVTETQTSADGTYSSVVTLTEGENPIIVKARDLAGNMNLEPSDTITIVYSTKGPKILETNINRGNVVPHLDNITVKVWSIFGINIQESGIIVSRESIPITGTLIKDPNTGITNTDIIAFMPTVEFIDGNYSYTVYAEDSNGKNTTETYSFVIDSTVPDITFIGYGTSYKTKNRILVIPVAFSNNNNDIITNRKVYFYFNQTQINSTTVNTNYQDFSINMNRGDGDYSVKAEAQNQFTNLFNLLSQKGIKTLEITLDTKPPKPPRVRIE